MTPLERRVQALEWWHGFYSFINDWNEHEVHEPRWAQLCDAFCDGAPYPVTSWADHTRYAAVLLETLCLELNECRRQHVINDARRARSA
jgi:hypothetical protein